MQALLAQLSPAERDPAANARTVAEALESHPEVDLALFPELFLSGCPEGKLEEVAVAVDGPELGLVAETAGKTGTAVVVGFTEPVPGGFSNSAACIDSDGQIAGIYRKICLFDEERTQCVPGNEVFVLSLAGRRVAPMICFDMEFPEVARAATRDGAELLVTISANMHPFYNDHELHSRARALENRLPHLYVNRVGSEAGYDYVGGTRTVAVAGQVEAEAAHDREELLVASIPERDDVDGRVDYLQFVDALPDLKSALPSPRR
jgi:predicted amidohydrolase